MVAVSTSPYIQLARVQSGSKSFDVNRIHPDFIRENVAVFQKYILQEVLRPGQSATCEVHFGKKKPYIKVISAGGIKKITIDNGLLEKLRLPAQKTAEFARRIENPSQRAIPPISGEKVRKMKDPLDSNLMGRAMLYVDPLSNGFATIRQTLSSVFTEGKLADGLNASGFVSGGFWTGLSIYEMYNGNKMREASLKIGDQEGINRGKSLLVSGSTGTAASLLYLVGKGFEVGVSVTCDAAIGLGIASSTLFCVGSLIYMGNAAFGIHRCSSFRNDLDRYLNNPEVENETDRLIHAMNFLREGLIPEKEEDLTPEDEKKLQVKINYLKRRTSMASLVRIIQSDEIMAQLRSGDVAGVEKARALIEAVKADSVKKERLHRYSFVSALFIFLGMIASSIGTFGILPAVLFAAGAFIMLALFIFNLYKSYKDNKLAKSLAAQ
ncbi:MAG: hypothetical protein JSS32_09170 [Verrucomicrobia bacterium]|nr:hypothetical protein [Verrucomicrobiota bacterium]